MKAPGLPEGDFDLDKYRGMDPIDMMLTMRRDLEFKMPARGVSTHTAIFGGARWVRKTWRCEVEGCWYVCTPSSDKNLQEIQAYHRGQGEDRCPTAPRRESLPSGKMEIEKLWLEIDDTVDAIKAGVEYRGMGKDALNGFVRGLAFSIVMKDKEFYPDIKAVAAEALRRWKMRHKKIPWDATPSHFTHRHKWFAEGGWRVEERLEDPKPAPKKAAPRKTAKAPAVAVPVFRPTADQLSAIKAGLDSEMFTPADFAGMYGTTPAEIERVVG